MREAGKLGGRGRTRSVLGISDEVATDKLRDKARKALEAALSSSDEKTRFQAARSLYSYAATKPPAEEEEPEPKALTELGRAWLKGLAALDQQALEHALGREDWALIERVGTRDPELARAAVRFTERLEELAGRKGPRVKVEGGRLVAEGQEPPEKPRVHVRHVERAESVVPAAQPPAPPMPPAERKRQEQRLAEYEKAKAAWAEMDENPEPPEYSW